MTVDNNKEISLIVYNHLNLPTTINFANDNKIEYLYTATGQKVAKKVTENTTITNTNYLAGGFQYKDTFLQFFPHAEGYVNVIEEHYDYVFNYTDHLGNIRVSYGVDPNTGVTKILEENHYYPFGLKHSGYNMSYKTYQKIQSGAIAIRVATPFQPNYNYKYNGKELQTELGLNMYAMDMRIYDPAIARWIVQDPVVHHNYSSYSAFDNNPVYWADPSGADSQMSGWMQEIWNNSGSGSTTWNNNGNGNFSKACTDCPEGSHANGTEWIGSDGGTYVYDDLYGGWSSGPKITLSSKPKMAKANLSLSLTLTGALETTGGYNPGLAINPYVGAALTGLAIGTGARYLYDTIDDALADDYVETENSYYITLYRGVSGNQPEFMAATQGVAIPWSPIGPLGLNTGSSAHTRGNYKSIFTSWSYSRSVADYHATKSFRTGVVLMKRFRLNEVIPGGSWLGFDEGEFLVPGIVTGAQVLKPIPGQGPYIPPR